MVIYFAGGRTGQLFDLERDPHETGNLWSDAAHRPVRDALTAELLDWLYRGAYRQRERFAGARRDQRQRRPGRRMPR